MKFLPYDRDIPPPCVCCKTQEADYKFARRSASATGIGVCASCLYSDNFEKRFGKVTRIFKLKLVTRHCDD